MSKTSIQIFQYSESFRNHKSFEKMAENFLEFFLVWKKFLKKIFRKRDIFPGKVWGFSKDLKISTF